MRWSGPFRRRHPEPGDAVTPIEERKVWAEVALPPPLTSAPDVPVEADLMPATAIPALAGARSAVRLGFADGTSLELDDSSGASQALRDAAERLTTGEPA